jgi:cell wall assembly regulator SMI1
MLRIVSTVEASWARLRAILEQRAPALAQALSRPAGPKELARVSKQVGSPLPRDLAESLKIHNGMSRSYLDVNRLFNYEALLSTKTIASRYGTMKALHDANAFPAGGCLITRTRKLKNDTWWRPGWIPITDSDGNGYWIDLDPPPRGTKGQVFYFYNASARPRRVVAESYAEWLEKVTAKLARAKLVDGSFEVAGL